jgi:hypothetical protein
MIPLKRKMKKNQGKNIEERLARADRSIPEKFLWSPPSF